MEVKDKARGTFLSFALLLLFILSYSCYNSYERNLIGYYSISRINNNDVKKQEAVLHLQEDLKFIVIVNNHLLDGTWEASDDGDRTLIDFTFRNGLTLQGIVVGKQYDYIEILNPNFLFGEKIKQMEIYRNVHLNDRE